MWSVSLSKVNIKVTALQFATDTIHSSFSFLYLAHGSLMFAKTVLQSKNLVTWNFHCRHPPSANLHRRAFILTSLPVRVFAYFCPLPVSLCLFLFLSLPPSTYTNTNKHSCHSGLLLRASESPQMGTAKCRCHSASVPKKQGHLLWSQVTTGHLHVHTRAQTYTHKC